MSLSDGAPPTRATPQAIRAVKERRLAAAQIADGRLPSVVELYDGLGFASGDLRTDLRLWCDELLLNAEMSEYFDIIRHAKATCSRPALEALRSAIEHDDCATELARIDIYLAALEDREALGRVVLAMHRPGYGRPGHHRLTFAIAVARYGDALLEPQRQTHTTASFITDAAAGIKADLAAARELEKPEQIPEVPPTAEEDLHARMAELEEAIREDRAEIDPEIRPPAGLIVVPAEAAQATKHSSRKEILAGYIGIIGAPLPWITMPDLGAAVEAMAGRLPHAVEVFQRILGSLQPGDPIRYRPTLLVGEAGTGKTTLARTIAEILGQPVEVHGMAGQSDASIMGTSAQWANARESVVLQLIKRTRTCNPLIVLDELEKVGEGRQNGNASEALLSLLEPHTAKAIRDPALEVPVDLSMVSYIATANSLTGIPRPLLDRFNVIRMPEPTWQHIGALSRGILDNIAQERSLRAEWFPDLAGDEIEVIKKAWSGGSIRRLEKAVRILVDGRDRYMGRA